MNDTRHRSEKTLRHSPDDPPNLSSAWNSETTKPSTRRKKKRLRLLSKKSKVGRQKVRVQFDWANYLEPAFDPDAEFLSPEQDHQKSSLSQSIDLYERLRRMLKKENSAMSAYPRQVYVRYLDKLFLYPLTDRHSNCINKLRPTLQCCKEEGCPTIVFSDFDEGKKASWNYRRRKVIQKLRDKLNALGSSILRKFSLEFPEMPSGRSWEHGRNSPYPFFDNPSDETEKAIYKSRPKNKPGSSASTKLGAATENLEPHSTVEAKSEKVQLSTPQLEVHHDTLGSKVAGKFSYRPNSGHRKLRKIRTTEIAAKDSEWSFDWGKRTKSLNLKNPSSLNAFADLPAPTQEKSPTEKYKLLDQSLKNASLELARGKIEREKKKKAKDETPAAPPIRQTSVYQPFVRSLFVIPHELDSILGGLAIIA